MISKQISKSKQFLSQILKAQMSTTLQQQQAPKSQSLEEILKQFNTKNISQFDQAGLPIKFKGYQDQPRISKQLDNLIVSNKQVPQLQQVAHDTTVQFLKALESGKEEDFPLMETNFYIQTQRALQALKENKFQVKVVEEQQKFKQVHQNTQSQTRLVELMHYLGLSQERAENFFIEQYDISDEYVQEGLLILNPPVEIVDEIKSENMNDLLKQQEIQKQKNAEQRNAQKQLLLRAHFLISTPFYVQILNQKGESVSPQPISFTHKITLENQLKLPVKYSVSSSDLLENLASYRLNRKWQLSDFDGESKTSQLVYQESQKKSLHRRA